MSDEGLSAEFESARKHLHAVALRLTGNPHDADDVLQAAWMTAFSASRSEIEAPVAWLTTVVSREALDLLRRRRRRRETSIDEIGDVALPDTPENEALWVESVGRALLVVLDRLTPLERVAFVLHDLFAVPFDGVAEIVGRSPQTARKLASRARQRVRPPLHVADAAAADTRIVEAYLAASRAGDIDAVLRVLAPGVVRHADVSLVSGRSATRVCGQQAVGEQTRLFIDRARVSVVALIDSAPGIVVAPQGKPSALMTFRIRRGLIEQIDVIPAHQAAATIVAMPPPTTGGETALAHC
jgi:RNA polymerase sigma-70 factor, ECF subfamily